MSQQEPDVTKLLQSLSFKTAFKATLRFYTGQFVATLLGLVTIATVIGTIVIIGKVLL